MQKRATFSINFFCAVANLFITRITFCKMILIKIYWTFLVLVANVDGDDTAKAPTKVMIIRTKKQ